MADPADLRDLAADFPPGSLIAGTLLGAADEIDRLHELRYVKGENLRQRLAEVIRDKWDSERSAPNADMAADAVMDHLEGLPIEACHRCATDQPTPAHYCPACRTTTPATTAEQLVQAGADHRAVCTGPADLRQRIAAAFERMDAHQWGYDHGFCGSYGVDPETDSFIEAAIAEMQPKLDQRDQHIAELQDKICSFDDNGKCCCSFDGPGDVCDVHSPMVKQLRAELRVSEEMLTEVTAACSATEREAAQLRAEVDRTRAELAEADSHLRAIALVRVWRNEDGREFMFADDIRTALGVPTRAASAPTT